MTETETVAASQDPIGARLREVVSAQPAVLACTVGRDPADATRHLIHVVPDALGQTAVPSDVIVESWRMFFDANYETALEATDPGRAEITGWHNSFTDFPLDREEMDEWAGATVDRVLALRPRRVLEIGAGSGMVLKGLMTSPTGPESYLATDFSEPSIAMLTTLVAQLAWAEKVHITEAEALDAARLEAERDTTIVNSVIQYLPSLQHLERLIGECVARTDAGGHVFLGDVRHADLLTEFASLKVYSRQPDVQLSEARQAVQRELDNDGELSVSPRFFAGLPHRHPRVSAVEVVPRRGRRTNEMSLFRYDVVVHVECDHEVWTASPRTPSALDDLFESHEGGSARDIANARLRKARELAAGWGLAEDGVQALTLDPEDVWELAARVGRTALVSWAAARPGGGFDVDVLPVGGESHYALARPVTRQDEAPGHPGPAFSPLVAKRHTVGLSALIESVVPPADVDITFVPFLSHKGQRDLE